MDVPRATVAELPDVALTTADAGATVGAARHRLAGATERLREAGVLDLDLDRVPTSPGWSTLPSAADEVLTWHDQLTRRHGDPRAAAAFLSNWLLAAPALVVALPALIAAVVPDVAAADELLVHRHEGGWFDAYAIAPVRVRDADEADVLRAAAAALTRLVTPLAEELCAELPVGTTAVWGGVADTVAAYALWFTRATEGDATRMWARTDRLLDAVAARAPLRVRPSLQAVVRSGGTQHIVARGTCCLHYRTTGAATCDQTRYCATCPLRAADSRASAVATRLEADT